MRIDVDGSIHLTEVKAEDRVAFLQHLKEKEISEQTLRIPYPYTEADADAWIAKALQDRTLTFAIRVGDGFAIGSFGFEFLNSDDRSEAEIGYWIAKTYWGRGIATSVVRRMCRYGFEELGLRRITAEVFAFNPGSCRVLEKCGFRRVGVLPSRYRKSNQVIDAIRYVLEARPPTI